MAPHNYPCAIDITHLAIGLIKHRLQEQFGAAISQTYRVIGEPVSVPDAERLAKDDPFQFQAWALGLVGARKEVSKGPDRGIDGVIYFYDDASGKAKKIIISAKAGANISVSMVRDLVGTLTREKADLGVLLTFTKPTKPMEQEAADAGFYNYRIVLFCKAFSPRGSRPTPSVSGRSRPLR
jgi:site-specific DNA-methyltransferase (adenine-specific)